MFESELYIDHLEASAILDHGNAFRLAPSSGGGRRGHHGHQSSRTSISSLTDLIQASNNPLAYMEQTYTSAKQFDEFTGASHSASTAAEHGNLSMMLSAEAASSNGGQGFYEIQPQLSSNYMEEDVHPQLNLYPIHDNFVTAESGMSGAEHSTIMLPSFLQIPSDEDTVTNPVLQPTSNAQFYNSNVYNGSSSFQQFPHQSSLLPNSTTFDNNHMLVSPSANLYNAHHQHLHHHQLAASKPASASEFETFLEMEQQAFQEALDNDFQRSELAANKDAFGFDWSFVSNKDKQEKIMKWKAKKHKIATGQSQSKTYVNRSRYANIRPRVNGRFVSRNQLSQDQEMET